MIFIEFIFHSYKIIRLNIKCDFFYHLDTSETVILDIKDLMSEYKSPLMPVSTLFIN